jgi:heat shock protein HslJ
MNPTVLAFGSLMLAACCACAAGQSPGPAAPAPGASAPDSTGSASAQAAPPEAAHEAAPPSAAGQTVTTAKPSTPPPVTRYDCGDKAVGVRLEGDVLALEMDGVTHKLEPARAASGARYEGQGPGDMGRLVFWNKGQEATLIIGERTFPPCVERGEVEPEVVPSKLAGTEWIVEAFNKTPLEDDVQRPTLVFDEAQGLAGTTSCNRYAASVTVEGAVLEIGPARVTRMACEPALMKQEGQFLEVIEHVEKYEIRTDGWLVLTARGGKSLAARPKENEAPKPKQ